VDRTVATQPERRTTERTTGNPPARSTWPTPENDDEIAPGEAKSDLQGAAPDIQHESRGAQEFDQEETPDVWRDRALRLQAEIENFRRRQQRLAEERILADRERLLRAFLGVADNLERALATDGVDAESLRQGVGLTHQTLMHLLDREGVEQLEARGEPFDPAWHEAIGVVPHQQAQVEPDTVVEVVEAGYRIGERLLRPARVIVAT
jgi:molecular chaperone GrpE